MLTMTASGLQGCASCKTHHDRSFIPDEHCRIAPDDHKNVRE
jgi:hypothetical protein